MIHQFSDQTLIQKLELFIDANKRYERVNNELRKKIKQRDNVVISKLRKENKKLKHSIHKAYTKHIFYKLEYERRQEEWDDYFRKLGWHIHKGNV